MAQFYFNENEGKITTKSVFYGFNEDEIKEEFGFEKIGTVNGKQEYFFAKQSNGKYIFKSINKDAVRKLKLYLSAPGWELVKEGGTNKINEKYKFYL